MPSDTWRVFGSLFREYATVNIAPEVLAALAQIESAGNPVARTYWRWRLTWRPFEVFQPASSVVGMYQLTDAAFADARPYCIRHHRVVEDCGRDDGYINSLDRMFSRVMPGHAIELAAVSLDRQVSAILARRTNIAASAQQKHDLAAVVHLCGAGPAAAFALRGFRLQEGERCGDHDVTAYLTGFNAMKRQFQDLAAEK